jgi:hypothetical protein
MEYLLFIYFFGGFISGAFIYYAVEAYIDRKRKKDVWRYVPKHLRIK